MEEVFWCRSWSTMLAFEKLDPKGKGENEREDR